MTKEEIIDVWVDEQRKKIKEHVDGVIEKLEKGEKPYYQFTRSFEETMNWIMDVHGEERVKEIKDAIGLSG